MKYLKGDIVRVWSLQSWQDGGFLKGAEAIVIQDQIGDSVLLAVERKIGGVKKVDPCYEVYAKQTKFVRRPTDKAAISTFSEWLATLKQV